MKKIIIFSFLTLFSSVVFGAEKKYPIDEIPKELLQNAKAVIRKNSQHFTIKSIDNGKLEVTTAITIMNKSGLRHSLFIEGYDKFRKLKNIKGTYYDKFGDEIKKIKSDDYIDFPSIAGYSLYEDNRVIFYDPEIEDFPFTFEYSYTMEFKGFLTYPSWQIYNDYNVSIQENEFKVTIPSHNFIRFHYQNLDLKPEKTIEERKKEEGRIIYKWHISNLPAIDYEPFSPSIRNFSPVLFLAPVNFSIGGYNGNMESWKDFGNWIFDLGKDKNILPDQTKEKISELVMDVNNDEEKIKILYKYMQDKTRYVNISVGMGGWQPFEAEIVDRLSYGDCKALSNYMKSLLDVVGIKSYYTIVKAGSYASPIISDFTMNQFNHAILCVPTEKDTMWLECTNQKIPAGYIGDFTDNRDVLIINKDASELVRTKSYNVDENLQKRNINFTLDENGEGLAEVQTEYIGLSTEDVYGLIDLPNEDIKRYLYKNLEIPDFSVISFKYAVDRKIIPEIKENLSIQVKNYSAAMGNRLIVPLNLMNNINKLPKRVKDRKTNVVIRRSGHETDNINYIIPEGYIIESIPEGTTISSKFGEYKTEVNHNDNTLSYKRTLTMQKGEFEPEEYNELRNFLLQISKADNAKFVLTKN
ncbi:MAG: DUF3857 domain-containing protein [Bacteroidales bacterium]|nr:DUF3857 domain-containing protein [Bacteroidales bacterium]